VTPGFLSWRKKFREDSIFGSYNVEGSVEFAHLNPGSFRKWIISSTRHSRWLHSIASFASSHHLTQHIRQQHKNHANSSQENCGCILLRASSCRGKFGSVAMSKCCLYVVDIYRSLLGSSYFPVLLMVAS
jgi:hypothetical protein